MRWMIALALLLAPKMTLGEWRISSPFDSRQSLPREFSGDYSPIRPGDQLPDEKFHWLIGDLVVPDKIGDRLTSGEPVGLQFNCGDGGEVYLNGELQARYDNDHPTLVLVAERAVPGAKVKLAVQVYGKVQGGDRFDEAQWVIVDSRRAREPVVLHIDSTKNRGQVPDGIIGLSQGAGLAEYSDELNAMLRDGGFKWFRMDNILTNVLRETKDARLEYDWADFDRRVDFIHKMGAEMIFAVSYMPQVLDALENHDRQSAPRDYGLWEELCYQAAKRCVERGKPVRYWEVWNEANSGWIKPGIQDRGGELFKQIYAEALGREEPDQEIVRRFEAYCKLYRATAEGVLRADPNAKVGGPALASGPFEREEYPYCHHGRGFARGLMLWCRHQKLPLDFVSWHEYFHPAEVIAGQADTFRKYLKDFPEFQKSVKHFMLTEWNEAWWPNRPQDHELGAAWCADGVIRAFLPHGIDRPCFFYVKQNDMGFRGDWSMIMGDRSLPKPTYHMARMFNQLSGRWLSISGGDDDVCAVAAWDAETGRLAIVLVNFRFRHAMRRTVRVNVEGLPASLTGGRWQAWTIDPTHSNVWHNQDKADLARTGDGPIGGGGFTHTRQLEANSVTLLELLAPKK